ncbi:small acid-soluble spore protein H [Pueribacillus sp. YX66]|uniref:small acid-soluble spore protein H n=1 Tax=Pueribacillus sp. YX66 TaxID=3229242 RepID=UPI00358D800C
MDRQRAKEIASSPTMAHVTFNGVPIYIQNVHEQQDVARIYPLDDPENEQDVPLAQLEEH